jgi:hypothetical protein
VPIAVIPASSLKRAAASRCAPHEALSVFAPSRHHMVGDAEGEAALSISKMIDDAALEEFLSRPINRSVA